jgi:serine/threonine protein kinase
MLKCLEALHRNQIVHRNVCPENFLVDQNAKIYLIDFAYVSKIDPREDYPTELEPKSEKKFQSLDSLKGRSYSFKDDLESLGFCLVELAKRLDRNL